MKNPVQFERSLEFQAFLDSLMVRDKIRLLARINQIEVSGMQVAISKKWVKKIESNLFEIRSQVGSNIQRALYFHNIGNQYLILTGFTKKTQKTPRHEIQRAKQVRNKYEKGGF
ncbi:MAG TPA: type II toxin-antitoxin system RelE/ParE family toxin [Lactobacillus sp.]|nr:type II toxin-antitoxin system RelE/ParE family toxin [Lactobacillus sp.]